MPFVFVPVGWVAWFLGADPNSTASAFYPGWHILKFWQGIVDIVLRGVALLLAFMVFVLGIAFYYSVTGWLCFAAFCVIVEEIIIIVFRFVNPIIIWKRPQVILIYSIIYYIIVMVMIFPGFVAAAVYSSQFFTRTGTLGAVAAFSVFLMLSLAALLVWSILWYTQKWHGILQELCGAQTQAEAPAADTEEGHKEEIATD